MSHSAPPSPSKVAPATPQGTPSHAPPGVLEARRRKHYVDCAVCQVDHSRYLFTRLGVRFVKCATCGLVYVNPVGDRVENYFDLERNGRIVTDVDRKLLTQCFEQTLETIEVEYGTMEARPLRHTVIAGKYLSDFESLATARRIGMSMVRLDDDQYRTLSLGANVDAILSAITEETQLLFLHELLEACADPAAVLSKLALALPHDAWIAISYTNADSLSAKVLRRHYPPYFGVKKAFFSTNNLAALCFRFGFAVRAQFPYPHEQTVAYIADRILSRSVSTAIAKVPAVAETTLPVRVGNRVALFRRPSERHATEKLSVVIPVHNEVRTVAAVIESVLGKELPIDKELIVVESASTDGSRDVVARYEGHPNVRVLYEHGALGKGHAVRTGLAAVTGTIVLIQDADFEYDVDDYDALLEPILQRRTNFVLGSRSLGLDDWKERRYGQSALTGMARSALQSAFSATYNLLYQQNLSDIDTMFKVFRTELLTGLDLRSNGFELGTEIVCKLVRNGNEPIEVPVNYVARGQKEGKKRRPVRDSLASYLSMVRHRLA